MNMLLGIGLVWACVIGIVSWKRPMVAIFLVFSGTHLFLLRFEFFGIPSTVLEFGIYGLVLGAMGAGLWRDRKKPFFSIVVHWLRCVWNMWKLYIPVLVIWLIPTLIAGLEGGVRGIGIIKAWFFDPIVLTLAITTLTTHKTIDAVRKSIVMGLFVSVMIMSVYGLFGNAYGGLASVRLASYFETPNYVALYLVPILFLVCAFVWERRKKSFYPRRFVVNSVIVMLVLLRTLQLTDSYGGFMALAGGSLIFIVCMPVRWIWKASILIFCAFGVIAALQFGILSFPGHYNDFFKVDSASIRTELWQGALYLIETDYRQPWVGVGLGQFQQAFWRLYYTGPDMFTLPYYLLDFHLPHNLYLAMAVEAGSLALFGFLSFVGMWLWKVGRALYKTKDIFLVAVFSAMIAVLIHGFVDTPYFKNDLSLLFWILVVVGILSLPTQKAQAKS